MVEGERPHMKLIALKDISPEWKKDQVMEHPDATGHVLILNGAAREVTDEDEKKPRGRRVGAGTYHRRDLQADTPTSED